MPPRLSKRGGARRRRRMRNAPSLTLIEASEKQFATRSDIIHVRGKQFVTFAAPTTSPTALFFLPGDFGARGASMASLYSRWRVEKVLLKVYPLGATGTIVMIGIQDDNSAEGGGTVDPTTATDVLALRTSCSNGAFATTPTLMEWSPIDRASPLWYFTQGTAASGDDVRLVAPFTLWAVSSPSALSTALSIEMHYTLSFKSATQSGAAPT